MASTVLEWQLIDPDEKTGEAREIRQSPGDGLAQLDGGKSRKRTAAPRVLLCGRGVVFLLPSRDVQSEMRGGGSC